MGSRNRNISAIGTSSCLPLPVGEYITCRIFQPAVPISRRRKRANLGACTGENRLPITVRSFSNRFLPICPIGPGRSWTVGGRVLSYRFCRNISENHEDQSDLKAKQRTSSTFQFICLLYLQVWTFSSPVLLLDHWYLDELKKADAYSSESIAFIVK